MGQEVIKTILQNAVRGASVSHAYLFAGPRGVGKTTIARILAKAVNCLNPVEGEPDTTCENCVLIQQGRFLDLLEIDAASYTGVDNIRDIIDHVKFSPSRGKYKVFIIDEVHMLSKAAFNALLKTLEEPPAHAIFILATTEISKVPATIISRSQRFDFKRVAQAEILKLFETVLTAEQVKISREAQTLIAGAAEGSFRDALSILQQLLSFGRPGEITFEQVEEILGVTRISASQKFLDFLTQGETAGAIKFVKNLVLEGKDLVQFTRNFLEYLRLVLFVKMDIERAEELGLQAEDEEKLRTQSQAIGARRLLEIIRRMLEAYREIKLSPVPELPLLAQAMALGRTSVSEIPPAVNVVPVPAPQLDLGTVIDRWAEVLAKVREYNHSLLGSLRLGRIVKLEGRELILAFPYNFHKETIEARKNRIVVEQVLEEVFHEPVRVKVVLERELGRSDLLSEAVKVLGNNPNYSDHSDAN